MIIISAMSEARVIGGGDGMPWNVPEEYQQYLRFVAGNAVIMGRKTFEIFGADLPPETSIIVVTHSPSIDGAETAGSLQEAILMAKQTNKTVYVAGGGSIYVQAIPLVDEMYLSTIKGKFEGDAYFPEFSDDDWNVVQERDEPDFIFRVYRRSAT